MFLLKAHDRDKFGDRTQIDITKIQKLDEVPENLLKLKLQAGGAGDRRAGRAGPVPGRGANRGRQSGDTGDGWLVVSKFERFRPTN